MHQSRTRLDQLVSRIKANPLVAGMILVGTVVIALSSFTDAARHLWGLVVPDRRPAINGEWRAHVTYDWPNAHYTETFTFSGEKDAVRGTASFLGTKRGILEGKVAKGKLEFVTKTQEVLDDWKHPREAVNRYHGEILKDEIKFIMQTEGGYSEHVPVEFAAKRIR